MVKLSGGKHPDQTRLAGRGAFGVILIGQKGQDTEDFPGLHPLRLCAGLIRANLQIAIFHQQQADRRLAGTEEMGTRGHGLGMERTGQCTQHIAGHIPQNVGVGQPGHQIIFHLDQMFAKVAAEGNADLGLLLQQTAQGVVAQTPEFHIPRGHSAHRMFQTAQKLGLAQQAAWPQSCQGYAVVAHQTHKTALHNQQRLAWLACTVDNCAFGPIFLAHGPGKLGQMFLW